MEAGTSSIHFFTNYKNKGNRKQSRNFFITVLVLLTAMIFASGASAEEDGQNYPFQIDTVYHVFYGEERIGIVDETKVITDFEAEYIEEYSKKYEGLNMTLDNEITMIPEVVFHNIASNQEALELLKEKVILYADTYVVSVGDKVLGHINANEDMEEFIQVLLLEYVSEEELETYDNESGEGDLEVGEDRITDIRFTEEIYWEESSVTPEEVMSVKEALKMIQKGTLEEEIYTVKEGDVLGSIANEHDLTLDDILAINPDIKEDSFLQIGDELNVTVLRPMTSVIVEKEMKKEETISFETETKEDSEMWQGTTKVTQEGKDGKKVVQYSVTYENGRSVKTETISEEVTQEPVNKVVVKGTKTSPSRGSGSLSWPAVGGYISSYMGPRWGRQHNGIDIARPTNRNILAADNGTIKSVGYEGGYGNVIRIDHNNGLVTLYAHLSSMSVSVGDTVGKGQVIGQMGSTGNSTGVHLHFEVYENGNLRNPMDYLN